MNKEWFATNELLGLPRLPTSIKGLLNRATSQNWRCRRRAGIGGGFEYHVSCLPEPAVEYLAATLADKTDPDIQDLLNAELEKDNPPFEYNRETLWAGFEKATAKQKEKAKLRIALIDAAQELMREGAGKTAAFKTIAEQNGMAFMTLWRSYEQVRRFDRSDWLPAALCKYTGNTEQADISEEAWDFFKGDFLRLEQPSLAACYQRLKRAAQAHGWTIPSKTTLNRRIKTEIPRTQLVLMREGEHALMSLYPSLQRTVAELSVMEWINGDGYQHNVFVRWPDGTIGRPKTWFWQDIKTRKMLAWRTDFTENTDVLRQSFGQLVERYGIPEHATIDNTRAAANKWMTGGVANRYRFKVKEDDPMGIMVLLGVKVHWTSVFKGKGHGQAKPIERMFGIGGLGEYVDKDPAFAGAFTGNNPMAKPENYGEKAIDFDVFVRVLNDRMEAFNAMTGRRTEECRGELSFNQAFEQLYATAQVRKATAEQRRLWLLPAEAMLVSKDGTVTLDAGRMAGQGSNRYGCDALLQYAGQKVVVRFDPQQLHNPVFVDTLDGRFITEAPCIQAAGFGDTVVAREHNRARKQFVKANKEAASAQQKMDVLQAAALLPGTTPPEAPHSTVVKPMFGKKAVGHDVDDMESSFVGMGQAMISEINKRHLNKV